MLATIIIFLIFIFQSSKLNHVTPYSCFPIANRKILRLPFKTLNNLDSAYLDHYSVQFSSTPKLATHQINSVFPIILCIFILPCAFDHAVLSTWNTYSTSQTLVHSKPKLFSWGHTWVSESNLLPFPVSSQHLWLYLALTLVCIHFYFLVPLPYYPPPTMQWAWKNHESSNQVLNIFVYHTTSSSDILSWPDT